MMAKEYPSTYSFINNKYYEIYFYILERVMRHMPYKFRLDFIEAQINIILVLIVHMTLLQTKHHLAISFIIYRYRSSNNDM